MKHYFDIVEKHIKTIGVEAPDYETARKRAENAYNFGEIEINHDYVDDDVDVNYVQEEVENCIRGGDLAEDEIETFNCSDVIVDAENHILRCPICLNNLAPVEALRELDYCVPKFCSECGNKLHY